eukprot:scaffold487_cov344-Prasinococcus_capsulatus_cf.AAC.10
MVAKNVTTIESFEEEERPNRSIRWRYDIGRRKNFEQVGGGQWDQRLASRRTNLEHPPLVEPRFLGRIATSGSFLCTLKKTCSTMATCCAASSIPPARTQWTWLRATVTARRVEIVLCSNKCRLGAASGGRQAYDQGALGSGLPCLHAVVN